MSREESTMTVLGKKIDPWKNPDPEGWVDYDQDEDADLAEAEEDQEADRTIDKWLPRLFPNLVADSD